MSTTDLLVAVLTEHADDAPDVARTRRGIDAQLARGSRRPAVYAVSAAAAVVAVATGATLLGSDHHDATPAPPARSTTVLHRATPAPPPEPTVTYPYRAGWLPPGASFYRLDYVGDLDLSSYTFGEVDSAQRGLTLWLGDGPLPTSLRDGGTVHRVTIQGRPATQGWSPRARSFTVFVLRPDGHVMTVLAYGFDQATAKEYATHTAREIEYGSFAPPTRA